MTVFTFSGLSLRNADGSPAPLATVPIYAKADTSYSTPLAALDMSGTTVLPGGVTADGNGDVPDFKVDVPDGVPRIVAHAAGYQDRDILSIDEMVNVVQASAASSATSAAAAEAAKTEAADTAATVKALDSWVNLGVTRYNLATDPHCATYDGDSQGWAYSAAGAIAVTARSAGEDTPDGRAGYLRTTVTTASDIAGSSGIYYRETGSTPGRAGDVYTMSMYIRASVSGLTYTLGAYPMLAGTVGLAVNGTSAATVAGQWVRLSATITMPGDYDGFQVWAREVAASSPPAGATIDATMAMVTRGSELLPYFDGYTPDTDHKGYAWSGEANASVSQMIDMTILTPEGVEADWATLKNKPSTFTPATHTHDAADITSGRVAAERLGAGTASGTTFLRGDGQWATPPSGGTGGGAVSSVAGKTGDVSLVKGDVGLGSVDNTTDLAKPISNAVQAALNGKLGATQAIPISQVNGLRAELDSKAGLNSPVSASQINAGPGVINPNHLGNGTTGEASRFLASDGVWRVPDSGSSGTSGGLLNEVTVYGDSQVSSDTVYSGTQRFGQILAAELGVSVSEQGYGGSPTTGVAGMAGAQIAYVTLTGNTLPDSGTVASTAIEGGTYLYTEGGNHYGFIRGVRVRIAGGSGQTLQFTRAEPGSPVDVPPGSAFVSERAMAGFGRAAVMMCGGNDAGHGVSMATRVALYEAVSRKFGGRFVAVSSLTNTHYTDGGDLAGEAELAAAFGGQFVNARTFLAEHGMQWAGLTPDAGDQARMAAGDVPLALFHTDQKHLNEHGRRALAKKVAQVLQGSGFIVTSGGGGMSDTEAPAAPTALTASAITATSFTISWAAAVDNVGVASYDVYIGGAYHGSTVSTSLNVTGRTAGTQYDVTVRARDAAGNHSPQSAVRTVTTTASSDNVAPSTPTNVGATTITSAGATITWTASTDNVGVVAYEVQIDGNPVPGEVATTSKAISGLSSGGTYSVRVRARDAAGNWSALSAAYTLNTSASGYSLNGEVATIADYRAADLTVGALATWAPNRGSEGGSLVANGSPVAASGLTPTGGKAVQFVRADADYFTVDWAQYAQPQTVVVVCRFTENNAYAFAGFTSATPWAFLYNSSSGVLQTAVAGTTPQNIGSGPGTGNWGVYVLVIDGASSRQYVNNTTPLTVAMGTDPVHTGLTVGANGSKSTPGGVEIARLVCINRALATSECEEAVAQLKAEHGIA